MAAFSVSNSDISPLETRESATLDAALRGELFSQSDLAMGVLLEVLPVEVVVTIFLEVDGIKNVYLNFNLFLEVINNFIFTVIHLLV